MKLEFHRLADTDLAQHYAVYADGDFIGLIDVPQHLGIGLRRKLWTHLKQPAPIRRQIWKEFDAK